MSEITKKALANSLKKLLSKKELSKITVKNITDDCGLNRQTFYYHFKDVYDLLEWIYTNEVIKKIKLNDTYELWQQGYLYIFNFILENKQFVKNTYNSISREYLLKFIYGQTDKLVIKVINEKCKGIKIRIEEKKIMSDFYKYAFVGIVQEWIENGMKENPEEIVKKVNSIIEGSFDKAINNLKI